MIATVEFDPRKLAAGILLALAMTNGATCAVEETAENELELRCAASLQYLGEKFRDTLLEQQGAR